MCIRDSLHDVGQQLAVEIIFAAAVQHFFPVDIADMILVTYFKIDMYHVKRLMKCISQQHEKSVEIASGVFGCKIRVEMNLSAVRIIRIVIDNFNPDIGSDTEHARLYVFPYGFRRHEIRRCHMLLNGFQNRRNIDQMFFFTHSFYLLPVTKTCRRFYQ